MSNRLVQWYRGENPDDARADDEITLDLAGQFPDEFQTYKDAVADFERIRTDLLRKMATPGDYLKQGAGEFVRGAAGMVSELPETAALVGRRLVEKTGLPIQFPEVDEMGGVKAGRAIRALGEKLSPDPVEGLEGAFWPSVVPRGLGQAAGFMAGGAAGKLLKVPGAVGIAGLGAASSYAPAWKEAKAAGASDEQAYDAAFWNGIVGTSEAIPLSRMLKRLDGVAGKKFTKMLWTAGKETFEESVQEAAQTYADNYIAREIYDKDRDLLKDLVPSAAAGGVTGFLFSAITQAIGAKLRRTGNELETKPKSSPSTTTTSTSNLEANRNMESADALDVRQNFVTDDDRAAADAVIKLIKEGKTETPQFDAANATLGLRINAAPALEDYFAKESEKALPRQLPKDAEVEALLAEANDALAAAAQNLESRTEPTTVPGQVAPASTPTAATVVEAPQPPSVAMSTPAPESGVVPTAVGDTLFERSVARRLAENPSWTEEQARRYEQGMLDARAAAVNVVPEDVVETHEQFTRRIFPQFDQVPEGQRMGLLSLTRSSYEATHSISAASPSPAAAPSPTPVAATLAMPAWRKFTPANGIEAVLALVEKQRASVAKGIAGAGKKAARLFEAFAGENSVADIDELFKDRTADSYTKVNADGKKVTAGGNKSISRKLAALLSPDGYVLVGTATKQTYKGEPTGYVFTGEKSDRLERLMAAGWKLVGAIKADDATKGYAATYSPAEWESLSQQLMAIRHSQQGTAAKMEQKIKQGRDFGRENEGDEDQEDQPANESEADGGSTVAASAMQVDFEPQELAVIARAIGSKQIANEGELVDALESSPEALKVVGNIIQEMMADGVEAEVAAKVVQHAIYEIYTSSRGASQGTTQAAKGAGASQKAPEAGRANTGGGSPSATGATGSGATQTGADASGQGQGGITRHSVIRTAADPWFYSRLNRTVEQSQQGRATGAQWKSLILNSKLGVNRDEFAIVGVSDLEDGKTYTKQEVLDYLRANEVVVKDVTLEQGKDVGLNHPIDQTHFSSYQLPGAKEGSYREVLLTVPRNDRYKIVEHEGEPGMSEPPFYTVQNLVTGKESSPFETREQAEKILAEKGTGTVQWNDGHSQYSDVANPIVRLRFNERVTADGKKMLFLEEVQAPQKGQFEKMPALFQKNWREIAFKWALRHAAENGFEAVGWTTGEQQAARYDLSKQVDAVEWYPATATLNVVMKGGDSRYVTIEAGKNLEDYVGKGVAERLRKADYRTNPEGVEYREVSGAGLKIGGEGLSKLYDSDFRNVVNNLPAVKKSGQKVGTANIGLVGNVINYTDGSGAFGREGEATIYRVKEYGDEWRVQEKAAPGEPWIQNTTSFKTRGEAQDSVLQPHPYPIHSLEITQQIRDSVMARQARFSSRRPADQRNDLARFNALLSALGNLGVNVKLVTERLNGLVKEYGRYDQATGNTGQVFRNITLSLADATRPTTGNFNDLLEEALHAVYANETPARKAAMERAMRNLASELLNVELSSEYTPAEAQAALQEERLVAAVGSKLSAEGFNPVESAGFAQAIVRWLRDLYHRVVMAVMEASGLGASPQRVQAYFENRVKSILSGDAQMSVMDFLGGPKLTQLERIERDDPIGYADMIVGRTRFSSGLDVEAELKKMRVPALHALVASAGSEAIKRAQNHNATPQELAYLQSLVTDLQGKTDRYMTQPMRDKAMKMARLVLMSPSRTRFSASRLRFVDNPHEPVSPNQNGTELKKPQVAAQNFVQGVLVKLYDIFNDAGLNAMALTFEQFARNAAFVKLPQHIGAVAHYEPGKIPADTVAEINAGLQAIGQAEIPGDFKLADVNDPMRPRAASVAHRVLKTLDASLAEQRRVNARDVDRDFEQLQADNREWQDVLKDYTDLNLMQTVTGRRVNEIVKAFKASVKAIGTASHRAGVLEQVLVGLDRQIDRKNVTQWVKALETAASRISGGEVKFGDAIEAMARLGLDWETAKVAEIKAIIFASSDKALAPLLEEKNLPLLATLIAFSKSNANVMDMLSLRREAAVEERKTANEALQLALGAHETAVDEARALLKQRNLVKENGDLTRIGRKVLRILSRLQELKKRRRALLDKIENGKRFNEWYDASRPMLRSKLTELEKMIGAQYQDWQLLDGAEIPIPPKPNSSMEATLANTYTVNLKDTEGLLGALRKLRAWLDNVPEDQRGADWVDLDGIYHKASTANIFGAHRAVRQNWFMRLAAPMQDRLRFIGTATSKLLASRMYNMEQGIRRFVEPMNIVGHDWSAAEDALISATKMTQAQFRDSFYQPIMAWLEKNQDMLAEQKTDAAAENAAVRGVIEYLSLEDGTRDLMAKPGMKAKFERFLRQTAKTQRKLLATGAELGNKVLDATGEYKVYRDPIGAQLWTSLRATNETGHRVWNMMQTSPWATAKLNKEDAIDLYLSNPNTYTTPEVVSLFMRPWVNREGRSAFYAPAGEDGIRRFATRENVIKAAEASGGNLVTFAEALYELEDGKTDIEAYKTEVLHQWQANYDLLEMIYQEPTTGLGSLMPQISQSGRRFLADSRKGEELPGEWLEYLAYDVFTLQQVMKAQVFQSVFGRNFEAWTKNLKSAKDEQAVLADAWQQAIDLYAKRGVTGRALIKAAREEVRGGWKNLPVPVDEFAQKASLTALEQAARNLQSLNQTEQDFKNLMSLNQSRPMEFRAWQSLLGAMSGAVVSGPATALADNVAVVEQVFRHLGFNWNAVKVVLGIKKNELFIALNSLLQATHLNLQADSEHVRMANDLGWIDDDATISVKEKFAAMVMQEHNLSTGIASKAAQTLGQLIRMWLTTGIGRAREGTAVYPTLKLHSPFVMGSQTTHPATVMKFWQQFETFVGAAVKHLETHAADLHNPDFKFTREQIRKAGFKTGEREWQYYTTRLAEQGVGTLETVAVDAVRRRSQEAGAPLLTKDAYVKLAVLAQNDILYDSGLATRAPWLKTTVMGSIANPLAGWALHKAYAAVALGVRTPTGEGGVRDTATGVWSKLRGRELTEEQQQAISGTRTAMIAMVFGVLPAALAYALMRDWYDEYVMKKKGNVRPIAAINSPGDFFLTLLDNSARVGTFGIIGELANSNINFDSARPVTLDSRIFLVSTAVAFQKSLQNWIMQGSADWATVGRPMMQAMGGSGFLQYADSLNGMLGADNQESRVARRVGVNNYLRAAGRELDLDVRRTMGSISMPSKTKMYVGQMMMAALANDAAAFNEAHRSAVRAARDDDKEDPEASVKRSFAAYHPLRIVFQTVPSETEYRKLLAAMSDQGRASVAESLRLFNYYGEKIGVNPSFGRKPEGKSSINLGLPKLPRPLSLQDFRRAAVNFGNE